MQAAVLNPSDARIAIADLTLRPVGPGEVRVAITASGVCHTDLSLREGALPALLPCTLGHEGAGVVIEAGPDVAGVEPGDHVVMSWNVPCRRCAHCRRGEVQLCTHGLDHAFGTPYAEGASGPVWPALGVGSLAEQTVVPRDAVVPIDPALPLDVAALLGCAVTTGVGAAVRTAGVRPGESVLVIGCGGVGLAAVQGARLAGAGRIVAADRLATQLDAATRCGATHTIDAGNRDLAGAVRELTRGEGVDHAIEVVGKPETVAAAYAATRRGGAVTIVGAGRVTDTVALPALSLMADAKTIRGSVYGSSDPARDIPVLADLAIGGRLDLEALVSRRIPLRDVDAAFTAMAAGRGARTLVLMDGLDPSQ